jgi:hypothetical protein
LKYRPICIFKNIIYFSEGYSKIGKYNIISKDKKIIIDLVKLKKIAKYEKDFGAVIINPITNTLVAEIGYEEYDFFLPSRYLHYNILTEKVTKLQKGDVNLSDIQFVTQKNIFTTNQVFDFNLTNYSNICKLKNSFYKTYEYKNKDYVITKSDSLLLNENICKISIDYYPNRILEELIYKVIHESNIVNSELMNLNKKQLSILRNSVFAKHNYKFDSVYYQAFFNRYSFYYDEVESRTKNITLTEIDKQNLKLIKEAEKKAKE